MSKILKLSQYDLAFTTSFENKHGVSGHLYEMIEYFYVTAKQGIRCVILLTDGTTKDTLHAAISSKYNFSDDVVQYILAHTIECANPKVIIVPQICIVDGGPWFNSCVIYANHMWLLRCAASDFTNLHNHKTIKRVHLLQDFGAYIERYNELDLEVINYTKKILWSAYKHPTATSTDTGLLYLTTNCRGIDIESIRTTIAAHQLKRYVIVTDDISRYAPLATDTISIEQAPVQDIFERFDTYIYTPTPRQFDCSPRFIVECAVYGKKVIYDIDYVDPGIECRKRWIDTDLAALELRLDDVFVEYIKWNL